MSYYTVEVATLATTMQMMMMNLHNLLSGKIIRFLYPDGFWLLLLLLKLGGLQKEDDKRLVSHPGTQVSTPQSHTQAEQCHGSN